MKRIALLLILMTPSWASTETWTSFFEHHKDFVFDIMRKGKTISEWTEGGNRHFFMDYKEEFYVCTVSPVNKKIWASEITCADTNPKK